MAYIPVLRQYAKIAMVIIVLSFTICPAVDFSANAKAGGEEHPRLTDPATVDTCRGYVFEVIKSRRTVRKFRSDPVPEEHIRMILDAARMAPTSGNQQPWKFLVIRDRGKLDRLAIQALQWYMKAYIDKLSPGEEQIAEVRGKLPHILEDCLSAPVYVAVLVDSTARYPDYIIYDGTLAAGYLMIAARALGYGTGFFTSFFPEDRMKEFFEIPGQYNLICFTPIGVPDEWPATPEKKPLDEMVVWEEF